MTLLEIEILIHYYVSPTDYRDLTAPAIKEAIYNFVKLGLLIPTKCGEEGESDFRANREAIQPLIDILENLQPPIKKWVMPIGELNSQ